MTANDLLRLAVNDPADTWRERLLSAARSLTEPGVVVDLPEDPDPRDAVVMGLVLTGAEDWLAVTGLATDPALRQAVEGLLLENDLEHVYVTVGGEEAVFLRPAGRQP